MVFYIVVEFYCGKLIYTSVKQRAPQRTIWETLDLQKYRYPLISVNYFARARTSPPSIHKYSLNWTLPSAVVSRNEPLNEREAWGLATSNTPRRQIKMLYTRGQRPAARGYFLWGSSTNFNKPKIIKKEVLWLSAFYVQKKLKSCKDIKSNVKITCI